MDASELKGLCTLRLGHAPRVLLLSCSTAAAVAAMRADCLPCRVARAGGGNTVLLARSSSSNQLLPFLHDSIFKAS
jgi:hypothetical protein